MYKLKINGKEIYKTKYYNDKKLQNLFRHYADNKKLYNIDTVEIINGEKWFYKVG